MITIIIFLLLFNYYLNKIAILEIISEQTNY